MNGRFAAAALTALLLGCTEQPPPAPPAETAAAIPAPIPDEPDLAAYVAFAAQTVILPAHRAFADAAARQAEAAAALCDDPGPEHLAEARSAFAQTVRAWSRVEIYGFGPARQDNLHARIQFWPDRGGRGQRQIEALIAAGADDTALEPARLREKSVALQGLPALETVLYGAGAEALADNPPTADFRCRYGASAARVVARNAESLAAAWEGPDGFAALLTHPGGDNALYRTTGEAGQDLLRAGAESLEKARDLKLKAVLGDGVEKTRPGLAPFARSNLVLDALEGNVDAVRAVFTGASAGPLLGKTHAALGEGLAFELDQASETIRTLTDDGRPWRDLAVSEDGQRRLRYLRLPLGGALKIVRQDIPAALGLSLGFNSLDGD